VLISEGSSVQCTPAPAIKLLVYSHFFAPSIGGVETIAQSLARGLANLRGTDGQPEFEITLATQTAAGSLDDSTFPFRVIRQPVAGELWKLIRKVDILHIAGPALLPIVMGRLARKPVVVEHHGFQTICPNGQLLIEPSGTPCPGHFMAGHHSECFRCNAAEGWLASRKLWLLTFVRRFLCKGVAANITPTQWLGGLLKLPNSETIFHGLETGSVQPRSNLRPAPPTITFIGRLVTTKGVRLLFEAARILRSQNRVFKLQIIGDGPDHAALQQFALDAQLETLIDFAGRLKTPQIEAMLEKSLAVVVPSLGGEVFGLVVAENMLRGFPVVASDLGAFAEVVGDTGLLFQTGNASDLAAKLAILLDDPALALRTGNRCRERAEKVFHAAAMTDLHAKVFSGIVVREP
jgi:glycosyltransferase involved in cell wall biosynthesis